MEYKIRGVLPIMLNSRKECIDHLKIYICIKIRNVMQQISRLTKKLNYKNLRCLFSSQIRENMLFEIVILRKLFSRKEHQINS